MQHVTAPFYGKTLFVMLYTFLLYLQGGCHPAVHVESDDEQAQHRKQITFDQFIGLNAFVDDPIDKLEAVGFIREYHLWLWDEGNGATDYRGYPYQAIKLAPSYPGWNFDDFYLSLKKKHLQVSPCIQSSVPWLDQEEWFPTNNKPLDLPSAPADQAHSYHARASYLFQYAARYGSKQVGTHLLRLAKDQAYTSGLSLMQYIEDWNEPDRFWEGKKAEFSPQELAAMLSADYDGHERSMIDAKTKKSVYGVKNADPHMKLVMGGLSKLDINYVDEMNSWFKKNRKDQKFAADVLNFHVYAWRDGNGWQGGGPALSPEEAGFKEKMEKLVAYRDQHLPKKEIWVSEFGWDTHPASPLVPPKIGSFDIQEVQAQWILRAYLALAAAKVDRAQLYMLRDVDSDDPTHFATSGIVSEKGKWLPKKSWYYVYTMKSTLKDMVYIGEETASDTNLLIYKFKHKATDHGAYVLWAKSSEGYEHKNYTLSIPSNNHKVTIVEPVANSKEGIIKEKLIRDHTVAIDVSEKPVFVLVNQIHP